MDPTRVDRKPDDLTTPEGSRDNNIDSDTADQAPPSERESAEVTVDSLVGTPARNPNENHPESIGPYEISKLLGSGGMGSVYLGQHRDDGSLAAIKVLPASLAREPGFIDRFEREIAALEKLDCPYVVKLLGHGVEELATGGSLHFYVMEFVAGESLTDRLRREKKLAWQDVIDLSVQTCKALKAAHDAGIIHRDLKPSNLMINHKGQVKLADFGVAQMFATSKLTVTGGVIGTAEYMSPEQAEGRRVTKESDIYSLGALMYVALTGRPPFTGANPMDIAQKHRTGQFDAPKRWVPEIPHWLDEIVCRCLSKKPEDRYATAHILSRRLEEIPKKLELASSASAESKTAATVSATGEPILAAGGATFAAEMMKAELEQERQGGPIRRLFDSTWVLLALMVLVSGIGFVMTREQPVDTKEMFARGQELMQQRSLQGMRTARDDYFLPLLEINEDEWASQVEPLLRKIELAEVTRGTRSLTGSHKPTTEPQRLLHYALEQRRLGNVQHAEDTLAALRELVRHDSEQQDLVQEIDNIRGEIIVQLAELKRDVFIEDRRKMAETLREDGRAEDADAILNAIETIYGE